jgi:hypothetical protein
MARGGGGDAVMMIYIFWNRVVGRNAVGCDGGVMARQWRKCPGPFALGKQFEAGNGSDRSVS